MEGFICLLCFVLFVGFDGYCFFKLSDKVKSIYEDLQNAKRVHDDLVDLVFEHLNDDEMHLEA